MLYTQVNGGVTLMTEKGAIYTSWLLENSLDYSSNLTSEKGNWDQYFEGNLNNYKWEIVNERDAMSFQKNKEITGAMVALGGSIAVYGEKSDGSDWNEIGRAHV